MVMMKKLLYMAMVLAGAAVALAACQQEILPEQGDVPEGYMTVNFKAEIPDMQTVATKSVDADGAGIQNMTLFCFDAYGIFITVTEATFISNNDDLSGTDIEAKIPGNTRGIHFLANQNMTNFKESQFRNMSASEVIGILEGSSGRMIYWARFVPDNGIQMTNDQFKTSLQESDPIRFIRNHAFISVSKDDTNPFTVTGFVVYNSNAFGTVAPYHSEYQFDWDWEANVWEEGAKRADQLKFVNLPKNTAKMSGIKDVSTSYLETTTTDANGAAVKEKIYGQYIFECENALQDPVSVILMGYNTSDASKSELYYRVMLQDSNGELLPIRRNHHYKINITGELTNGKKDFSDAVTAAATNNIWIAISPDIKEVADVTNTLTVEQTTYVYTANTEPKIDVLFNVKYTNTNTSGTPAASNLNVSWIGTNNVSGTYDLTVGTGATQYPLASPVTSSIDGDTYNGKVTLNLNSLDTRTESMREGRLLIKYGQLQREVKVITIAEQEFKPTWISTQVYAGQEADEDNPNPTLVRDKVTFMYTIPENTPKSLFPMKVLISVNNLDVRSASGMSLPVVKKDDEDYSVRYQNDILDPNDGDRIRIYADDVKDASGKVLFAAGDVTDKDGNVIGYKYVHEIQEAGVQRVYFENILNVTGGKDVEDIITIEADHFKPVTKTFTFSKVDYNIKLDNAWEYNAKGANDDHVKYILVPQKANAHVEVKFSLRNGEEVRNADGELTYNPPKVNANTTDEFLLYSNNLDHYPATEHDKDGSFNVGGDTYTSQAEFYPTESGSWSTGGRVYMFRPREQKSDYSIYLKTNRAKSAEVVRISSNNFGSPSGTGSGTYNGQVFRSTTFELANYRPFEFAATVNETDTTTTAKIGYLPEQDVNIEFDITSFASKHEDTSIPNISVDPFGTQFEVYIDAPMLEIGTLPDSWKNAYTVKVKDENGQMVNKVVDKLWEETMLDKDGNEVGTGKFRYVVDAERDKERKFGFDPVNKVDEKADPGVQSGERKSLPFKLKKDVVVSEGQIVISADPLMVSFGTETFELENIPITGTVVYNGNTPVPAGKFVAFERTSDNSRIGYMTIGANGQYSLKLRQEYTVDWLQDEIEVYYEHREENATPVKYSKKYKNLDELYKESTSASPTMVLSK